MKAISQNETEAALKTAFSFLESFGYTYLGVEQESSATLGHVVTLSWRSYSAHRSLRVKYVEPKPHAPLGTLIVDIVNLQAQPVDDFDYTTMHSRNVPLPKLEQLEGTLSQRFLLCGDEVKQQASGELQPIFTGKAWEQVNFDWGGLK